MMRLSAMIVALAMGAPILGSLALAPAAYGATGKERLDVPIHAVTAKGTGERLGSIIVTQTATGARFSLNLKNLPPGIHGFHLYTVGSCEAAAAGGRMVPAGAAGTIYDPFKVGRHQGPNGRGYLGSLPTIYVTSKGTANQSITAPRVQLGDVQGRALLIKAGPDDYTDQPLPLGGSGDAIACGVVR